MAWKPTSGCNLNIGAEVADSTGKFKINDYVIYYNTNNYMLDSGFRLIDASSICDGEALDSAFCQMIPRRDIEEEVYITIKLIPVATSGNFLALGFKKSLMQLRMERVNMYLIHYPASPSNNAKLIGDVKAYAQTWLAISRMSKHSKVNAVGYCDNVLTHRIQLTEVVAIGPQVDWFSNYMCSYSGIMYSNNTLMKNIAIKYFADEYKVSNAQILAQWAIRRGAVIVPTLAKRYYIKEVIQLNFQISEVDLAIIDLLIDKNVTTDDFN